MTYHVLTGRHEPCINMSKNRAMQRARARVPVARARVCAREEDTQQNSTEPSGE